MNLTAFVIVLAFACCGASAEGSCCQDPFIQVGDECFYFGVSRVCWNMARDLCQSLGGDLAAPSNVSALYDYVFTFSESPGVWIGGSDRGSEGNWTYTNGEAVNPNDWSDGQPNNYRRRQHCLELANGLVPPLNDRPCRHEKPFVCEGPCVPIIECPPPSTNYHGECLLVDIDARTFYNAVDRCLDLKAELASPMNVADLNAFLVTQLIDSSVWLGSTDKNNEGVWKYFDGEPVTEGWKEGQPSGGPNEHCLTADINEYPSLSDSDCYELRVPVCEFDPL